MPLLPKPQGGERLALLSIDLDAYSDVIDRRGAGGAEGLIGSISHVLAEARSTEHDAGSRGRRRVRCGGATVSIGGACFDWPRRRTTKRCSPPHTALYEAKATRNPAGIVVVQVERVTTQHALPLRDVHIPGIFVDGVVVAGQTAEMDDQQPCQRQLSSVLLLRIAEVSGRA